MKLTASKLPIYLAACVSLATLSLPVQAESHCPGSIASVTPRLVAGALVVIPVTVNELVFGWKLAGITTFASGFPLTVTSAAPNELSTFFGAGTIRPDVVAGCNKSAAGSIVTRAIVGTSILNSQCFAAPGPFALGNEPRVDPALRAQGINNWDVSASKLTQVGERISITFAAEFFNSFNRVQFGPPNTSFGGPLYGKITSQVNNPRQIQFSLRASF